MSRTILWAWPVVGMLACNGGSDSGDSHGGDTECGATETENPHESSGGEDPGSSEGSTLSDTDASDSSSEGGTDPSTTESESGSRCGDGTCDADEDEASCCDDCTCAEGSSCIDAVCTPDPFCGDAMCNGDETQDDCCDDCGCAEGSECQESACVVLPVCGDGICNGTETMDDCCDDCGCGENYTCEANACACTDAWVLFENVLPAVEQYCFATNNFYTQEPVAYVNPEGAGWQSLGEAASFQFAAAFGDTVDATVQCCLLDACGGNLTCPTANGNYSCFCADPTPLAVDVAVCGENLQPVCG